MWIEMETEKLMRNSALLLSVRKLITVMVMAGAISPIDWSYCMRGAQPPRASLFLAVLFFIVLLAGCDKKEEQVRFIENPETLSCRYDKLLPSSNGLHLAIFDIEDNFNESRNFSSSEEFVVFSDFPNNLGNRSRSNVFYTAFGGVEERLRPISWFGQKLQFRIGDAHIGKLDPYNLANVEKFELPSEWWNLEITSPKNRNINVVTNKNIIKKAGFISNNPSYVRRGVFIFEKMVFYGVDISDRQNLTIFRDGSEPTKIGPAAFFYRYSVSETGNGISHQFLGARRAGIDAKFSNYALPVFDRTASGSSDFFQPHRLWISEAERFNDILLEGGYHIRDAVRWDKRIFVLAANDQNLKIMVRDDKQPKEIFSLEVCQFPKNHTANKNSTENHDIKTKGNIANVEYGIELSEQHDSTATFFHHPSNAKTKRLALYFHGGPASSYYNFRHPPQPLKTLQSEGFDVLAVEYSGSVGGGLNLSHALANNPMFGFQEDANAVRHWITQNDYSEVVLFATSFGAAPAMVLQKEYPDLVERSAYLAPLLEMPPTRVTETAGGRLFESAAGSQIQFEAGVFGSVDRREAFAAWLSENAASFQASKDDLFLFGELDTKAPLGSAPKNITDNAQIVVIPKASHQFLGSDQSTRERIANHLSGS